MPEKDLGTGPEAHELMERLVQELTSGKGKIGETQYGERAFVLSNGSIVTVEQRPVRHEIIVFPQNVAGRIDEIFRELTRDPWENCDA